MSSGPMQVPLIGQGQEMIQTLRLQVASQVVGQLAAVDFSTALQKAVDERQRLGVQDEENPPPLSIALSQRYIAESAVSYADALLMTLGIIRPRG